MKNRKQKRRVAISHLVSTGTHLGFEWMVTFHADIEYWCGYMKIPLDHPWINLSLEDINEMLQAPNELTFAGIRTCNESDPNGSWIGFDSSSLPNPFASFNQEYVEVQCRRMCEQANAALPCEDQGARH